MKQKSILGLTALSSAVVLVLQSSSAFAQLRAFGEAEGYGAIATGGRGGTTIYHVTNLNDSGVGSFRDAVSGSNRIVVFDVGGEITLKSGIGAQSNLTIAGQTAPGAGITITGYQAIGFTNRSNDILRYIRMRPGDNSPASDNGMSMTDTGTAILDHVSIEFGKYNNIDAVSGSLPHITIQNSIIADPISTGTSNRGQGFGAHLEAVNGYYTISNNLWANSHSRNPLAKVNDQFKNNIEYNNEVGYLTSGTTTPFKHDLVNNAFIAGPDYTSGSDYGQLSTPDKFYASGNVQDSNKNGVFDPTISNPSATIATAANPYHASTATLPTLSVNDAYNYVLAHAGVSLSRDQLDSLVVGQVQTLGSGTSGYTAGTTGPTSTTVPFDTVHEGLYWKAYLSGLDNGGLGTTVSSSRAAGFDADNDGVADAWELTHGMNPAVASDAFAKNPLGYLMIEQYLNELGASNDTRTAAGTSGAWATASTWAGAAVPTAMDYAAIRGSGAIIGTVSIASGTATAMSVSIGGGGPAAGETLNVNGGTLNVYDQLNVGDAGNATVNLSSGTLNAYNIVLGNTVTGGATINYTGNLNLSGGTLITNQIALGGGAPGAWTTGGQINFTGGTIRATAPYDDDGTFSNTALMTIKAPIVVSGSGGTIDTNSIASNISGTISGTGGIIKIGTGTLTLSGTNTNTGVTKVAAGTLAISALTNGGVAGNLGAATNAAANLVIDGGILQYVGTTATTTDRAFTMTAKGATIDAGTAGQVSFLGTADVAQSGTGNRTLLLTGNTASSNFNLGLGDPTSGKTSLTVVSTSSTSARWLIGASANPRTYSGDTTLTSGTLLTNASNVLPFGAGKGNLVITAGTVELNGNNLAINALTGAGTVNQRGSTNRTLTLGNGDASGSYGGTLSSAPLTTQGVLNITKVGTGTQTFTGTGTYAGATTVQAGVLKMTSGTYTNTLSNAGGINVQGGQFVFDYTGGTSPLTQVKALLKTSYANNNFAAGQIRDTSAGTNTGIAYIDSGTTLTLQPALYGDASLDGRVDFNDFLALQTNFGSNGTTFATGDFTYDGVTDFNDFLALQANFGQSLSGATVAVTAQQVAAMTAFAQNVPEPTAAVAMLAVSGMLMSRRRHSQ